MSARERGILMGLAALLAAAVAFFVFRGEGGGDAPGPAPDTWDLSRLPDLGKPVREFVTDGGVRVLVLREGEGEPVQKGQAIDVAYAGYTARSGAKFEQNTYTGLELERGGVIRGWIEGLAGTRPRELRRLLIPSRLAYGEQRTAKLAPNTDLVFDVEWVQLGIQDLRVGTGKEVRVGSKVLVHYRGTRENGVEFDSSYSRNEPIEFELRPGGLIEGWIRGIPGMKVGGTRKLWIPYHLAYGDQAKGPKIAPYSNLVFVVELLDVK